MWSDADRRKYAAKGGKWPRLLDAQTRELVVSMIPRSQRGRPAKNRLEDIVEALAYLLRSGAQWRYLPDCFPPFTSVQYYFYKWLKTGLLQKINHVLLARVRRLRGREQAPTVCVIDSQSVRTTGNGGPKGYDKAKSINGRKHFISTDTNGDMIDADVLPANIQDRDGGVLLLKTVFQTYPSIQKIIADEAHKGPKFADGVRQLVGSREVDILISPKIKAAEGFHITPGRWVIERSIAWESDNRRLTRSYEYSLNAERGWLYMEAIVTKLKRIRRASIPFSF